MSTEASSQLDTAAAFLQAFHERYQRRPRILHIGNIANNAFLNAKFLNAAGFDCDVLCYDYYHLMGCPEWEDADFDGTIEDQFRPDWTRVNLNGYQRPRWFVQGPQRLCLDYLLAKRKGDQPLADRLWNDLAVANRTPHAHPIADRSAPAAPVATRRRPLGVRLRQFWHKARIALVMNFFTVLNRPDALALAWAKLHRWAEPRRWRGYLVASIIAPFVLFVIALIRTIVVASRPDPGFRVWDYLNGWARGHLIKTMLGSLVAPFAIVAGLMMRAIVLAAARLLPGEMVAMLRPDQESAGPKWPTLFGQVFPQRSDQLTTSDYLQYLSLLPKWRTVLMQYDIVQAYATEVVYPMLTEKRPYLGFEHGTLRDFTLADNAISRLTALGYQQADRVFITNGDCLEYAQRIHVQNYTPMVHPIDEQRIASIAADYDGLHATYGARYLFVCPLRHDWHVKGTDQYIRALPLIADRIGRDFRVVMTEWGTQINDSKMLATALGVSDLIAWQQPLARHELVRLQKSADIVFDQIALPHFGATAPQAIAAGVPVIMSYDPLSTAWIVPEPAPILPAWNPAQIAAAVETAIDQKWVADYKHRARDWFSRFHSSKQVVATLAAAYEDVCRRRDLL